MPHARQILALSLGGCLLLGCGVNRAQSEIQLGPLFHEFGLTLAPGERKEVLGPLYNYEQREQTHSWALPPLFSCTRNAELELREVDSLYPVITYDRFGDQYRWHIFQLISFSGGGSQTDTNTHRFTLFPLYFQQRSDDPAKNYTALLPFYGHLQNRLFRSEIDFIGWPVYVKTKKRTQASNPNDTLADLATWNYFYPFVHRRRAPGLTGWQFWPFIGIEHKEVTLKTNHWGEVKTAGGHEKFFSLIYFDHRTELGTTNPVHQRLILPLLGYTRSPERDSTTAPWPIGYTYTEDRVKKFREWGAPWPLVVFARGEGKTTSRFFPLFSRAHNAALESDWYLWPVYKFNRLHSDPLDRTRHRVMFFLYSDATERNTETGAYRRRRDFFPFYTIKREFGGNERWQALSILEPFLPDNKSIERNWSPLWSLWRAEKNAATGATSQSLLWNLYRRDTTKDSRKCSVLFGLFQYRSGPEGKRWRVFFIPAGKSKKATRLE